MTRDEIFDKAKLRKPEFVAVPVPEFGQVWHVKEMSCAEDVHMQSKMDDMVKAEKGNAWFACCAVVDESGKRVFNDLDIENIITMIPAKVLRRVWLAGGKLNGMLKEDAETVEKNSDKEAPAASS